MMEALMSRRPVGLAFCDDRDVVTYVNDALAGFLGVGPECMVGHQAEEFLKEFIGDRVDERSRDLFGYFLCERRKLANAGPFEFRLAEAPGKRELWIRCESLLLKNGPNGSGRLESFVDVAFTAGQVASRSGRESIRISDGLNFQQTALEHAGEAIIITDYEGGILYVNPAFTRLMGYCSEEVMGRSVTMLESGDHDPAYYAQMWDTLRSGRMWKGIFCNETKEGRKILVDATISPVRDNKGDVVEFVAVERDVTREKAMEKHLRTVQKMQAVGTLAGGIAHDFNNVIHVISGYTQLAIQRMENIDRLERYLKMVLKACRRADNLVVQILSFCRQGEQPFKPVYLGSAVRETVRLLRATLPSHIEISYEELSDIAVSQPPSPAQPSSSAVVSSMTFPDVILADPTQIHQVVMNLCTNAFHAMEENGGVLEVVVGPVLIEDPVKFDTPSLEKGRYVKLCVIDSGCGMSQDVLERIFEPYYTTKEKDKGTGLGLTIVHGIVRNHGGDIKVKSSPGKGTVFEVYFPAVQDAVPEEDLTPVIKESKGGGRRILCVDDEQPALDVAGEMLRELGYEVTMVRGGLEALEVFRKSPDLFDAVLTDKVMPHVGGLELTRKIKQVNPNLPVILCTGYLENISQSELEGMGFFGLLHKPFAADQLGCMLEEALNKKPKTPSEDIS